MVTGSRDWDNRVTIDRALFAYWYEAGRPSDILLIHGGARGADALAAESWAKQGFQTRAYRAMWEEFGKRAGIMRNLVMIEKRPEHVLAFIKGNSRGASHAATAAEKAGIPVTYYRED
jgi:hypothetical protein